MKTKLAILLPLLFVVAFISCTDSESGEECSNPNALCPDDSEIDATACCTDTDCYWTFNGADYDCDGTDCDAVLAKIITSACVTDETSINTKDFEELKAQMQAVTQKLLIEARAAAGCDF